MAHQTFDSRYELIGSPKKGGMSLVYQAREISTNRVVAIKICKESNDRWLRDSFEAEHKALSNLSHPNIIKAFDTSIAADRTLYLVLEWVPSTLQDYVASRGVMPWSHYFVDIGSPLLAALRYAHGRRVAHRDLKPSNVLIAEDGTPKIADFGIARDMAKAPGAPTLRGAGSAPYTPPEPDDAIHSLGRDCWSWAAISISCLTGKIYGDLHQLYVALEKLDPRLFPVDEFRRALTLDPAKRYVSASELSADVEAFERRRIRAQGDAIPVAITFSRNCLERCMRDWSTGDVDVVRLRVLADLNEVVAVDLLEQEPLKVALVGATCLVEGEIQGAMSDQILVSRVHVLTLSAAERKRDDGVPITFVQFIDRVRNGEEARRNLKRLVNYVESEIAVREQARIAAEKERFFEGLAGHIREKERYYRDQDQLIHYSRFRHDGGRYTAILEKEMEAEALGESILIELANARPVVFDVLDVNLDQVVLRARFGAVDQVPVTGYVRVNRAADIQALHKQRTALEMVRAGRTVSAHLGDLLRSPQSAVAPEASGLPPIKGLSPDKHRVLEKALGIVHFLVVEGPPGTGKTTLIAEYIAQYLARYPDRRVLLSSQTHVALDHVITKLRQKGLEQEIVRIARNQEGKVDQAAAPLLLGRKVEDWSRRVEERSRLFIDGFAARYSADSKALRAGILGNERLKRMARVQQIDLEIESLRREHAQVEENRKRKIQQAETVDVGQVVAATSTLVDNIAALQSERQLHLSADERVCVLLSGLGEEGKTLASADGIDLPEIVAEVLERTADSAFLRGVIELQHRWLERLGASQDFYPAVLKEARVVCGTCVGLAGIQAIYDDDYDVCIVDEASKASATETLIPMSRSHTWMLVGDPKQLPPFVDSGFKIRVDGFSDEEVNRTLLSYLWDKLPAHSKEALSMQQRMVAGIGDLISKVFYDDALTHVRSDDERAAPIVRVFPKPVTWVSTSKQKAFDHRMASGSFRNVLEAEIVASLARNLNSANRGKKRIAVAVIAGYTAQVRLIKETLGGIAGGLPYLDVECNTVDAFQGRDADVCFYSVTRSNRELKLGFQTAKPRLNVALSRARDSLVIVGDLAFCRACPGENPFPAVIEHIEEYTATCEVREYERR